MNPATFNTITGAEWKRSLTVARTRRAGAPQRIAEGIRLAKPVAGQTTNLPRKPMNLMNDVARCDGLLPKVVTMPNGAKGVLWAHDCPCRETCARFKQAARDNPNERHAWMTHNHGPADECKDYIKEEA